VSPKLRSITARELIRALEQDGWTWARARGSHRSYKKGNRVAVVPYHRPGATFTAKTLARILAATGWTDDDIRRLQLLK